MALAAPRLNEPFAQRYRGSVEAALAARASGLPPGLRMGRYTLLRRLAVGGMAELYLAHQGGPHGFAKIVALKRMLPQLACDPELSQMFLSEARLAAGLDHPNLAQVLDFGESDGEYFLTMEYVHGLNLLEVLRAHKGEPLPLPCSLAIVGTVARALHHLHEHRGPDGSPLSLVHRDVSLSNVLVAYGGGVKLADFGIAKAMERTSATRMGTFKGKLGYASPEQCRGETIDRRSDVFALGILLYETTTGARAFGGPNEFAVLGRVANGDYVPLQEVDPRYPTLLSDVVDRALRVDRRERFSSAAELADALERIGPHLGVRGTEADVEAMMIARFGEAPPIATDDELQLPARPQPSVVLSVAPAPTPSAPPRRLPWIVAAAGIGAVIGAWAWGGASAPTPGATMPTVLAGVMPRSVPPPTPAPTSTIAAPAPEASDAKTIPATTPTPDRAAKPKRRTRRDTRRSAEPAPTKSKYDLKYPPGHN